MNLSNEIPALLDDADVAELVGVSKRTIIRWRELRQGPTFVQLGKRIRYRAPDVALWLESRRVVAPDCAKR